VQLDIAFPGGARVDASFHGFTVQTDQPPSGGGDASAPTPFSLFLASMGTCAGIYVLGFLRQRGLPTEGVRLIERVHTNRGTGMVEQIEIEILVPEGFPEKYLPAMIRSAELCAVKKHLEHPPSVDVTARTIAPSLN
jgi:ribosomal protein S12 methylthiotransferase accessory factor